MIQDMIRGWGYEPTAFLPAFNAVLNGLCTVLLVLGYVAVRSRKVGLHKVVMVVAFSVSTVFLASYLYYHFAVQNPELSKFRGEGWVRPVYFTILISHILLAVVVAVAAPVTLVLGLTDRIAKHKPLARWTLPVWLYVSITGVVVYWMLYRLYPAVPVG